MAANLHFCISAVKIPPQKMYTFASATSHIQGGTACKNKANKNLLSHLSLLAETQCQVDVWRQDTPLHPPLVIQLNEWKNGSSKQKASVT